MKETRLFELVTGTEMKPWLWRNMLPNINTCGNGWSNFSPNLRVVSLKLLKLTQFAWPNLSIYFNFLCAVPRDDVTESTRFLMRPPVPWSGRRCRRHSAGGPDTVDNHIIVNCHLLHRYEITNVQLIQHSQFHMIKRLRIFFYYCLTQLCKFLSLNQMNLSV